MAAKRQTTWARRGSDWHGPGTRDRDPTGTDDQLFGRDPELGLIRSLLESIDTGGQALLFVAEPGLGKTALLDEADRLASAAGLRVVRVAGAEFEADVGFSGLHQALLPLADEFERLGAEHQKALSAALGFTDGAPPRPVDVFNAVLVVLRGAPNAGPTLLIVDDVQWLDHATVGALGFIASRLGETRVGLIAAARSDAGSLFESGPTPHELQPLGDAAASRLLDARSPALDGRVRRRVMAEAQGNPLALLVLPDAFENTGVDVERPLPPAMPVGRRLQQLFATRIGAMPAETRRLLLLAALEGTGDLATLEIAAGDNLDHLSAADQDGLIHIEQAARRLTFTHPLVRGTSVRLATAAERREAHRQLALSLADDPDRRAWHLGEATTGHDEAVATLLEQVAARAMRRGDAVGTVAAWLRAAELSPPGDDQSRRFAEAAYVGADVLGELGDAAKRLDESRGATPGARRPLEAAVATAHLLLNGDGDVDTAHRLLVGAIATKGCEHHSDDRALIEALYTLLTICFFGGRPELWEPFDAALARLAPRPPAILSLSASLFADPARAKPSEVRDLDALIGGLNEETDPAAIVRTGRAAFFVDRTHGCREAQWRVVKDGRHGGAVTSAIHALINLSLDDYLTGDWQEAQALADEGLHLCEVHGYRALAWPLWFCNAMIAASRGDSEHAYSISLDMDRWAATRGVSVVQLYARHARAVAALGRGEFDVAYAELVAINAPGELPRHVPLAVWSGMDLVLAAVRTGRFAEASAHGQIMREASLASVSARFALAALGSAAIAAREDLASMELFERALAIDGIDAWPFDLARIRLAYGERLRRARYISRARTHLDAALEAFRRLGAVPWASRAGSELRAAGPAQRPSRDMSRSALSPQEREIAELAATGLTNKQIGERLGLSPRTVGGNLYRVYPKLGITSRSVLREALESVAEDRVNRP